MLYIGILIYSFIAVQGVAIASLLCVLEVIDSRPSFASSRAIKRAKKMATKTGNDLFIVDNSDEDWKVLN